MMIGNLFDVVGVVVGLILVYRAGSHLEVMTFKSNHLVRVAYWLVATGGASLVLSPLSPMKREEWMQPLGVMFVLIGVGLLFMFDRRRVIDDKVEKIIQ